MIRSCFLCIFGLTILSSSLVSSDEKQLKRDMERLKDICFREITGLKHYIRGPMVEKLFRALEETYENEIVREANIQHRRVLEESLENVVNQMKYLSAKVEELSAEVNNLKSNYRQVEILKNSDEITANRTEGITNALNNVGTSLNSSLELIVNEVEVVGSDLMDLQNGASDVQNLNTSVQMIVNNVDGLNTTALFSSHKSQFLLEGLIVETSSLYEVLTISLPSLQKTILASGGIAPYGVAFDYSSRKVYWVHGSDSIKRASLSLNGSDEEDVLQADAYGLAVDWISGNIYYRERFDIKVCSRNGEKCSVLATNQSGVESIALHTSQSLMFWSNSTSTVRANMDGTNASVIILEKVTSISVDEDSERLYWIDRGYKYIASSDFDGMDQKRILNDTNADLKGTAVHGDTVYFGRSKTVQYVSKYGGNPALISRTNGDVRGIALYGSKTNHHKNPCASDPCAHLCVPKLESFTCLCPQGKHLNEDQTTCT